MQYVDATVSYIELQCTHELHTSDVQPEHITTFDHMSFTNGDGTPSGVYQKSVIVNCDLDEGEFVMQVTEGRIQRFNGLLCSIVAAFLALRPLFEMSPKHRQYAEMPHEDRAAYRNGISQEEWNQLNIPLGTPFMTALQHPMPLPIRSPWDLAKYMQSINFMMLEKLDMNSMVDVSVFHRLATLLHARFVIVTDNTVTEAGCIKPDMCGIIHYCTSHYTGVPMDFQLCLQSEELVLERDMEELVLEHIIHAVSLMK